MDKMKMTKTLTGTIAIGLITVLASSCGGEASAEGTSTVATAEVIRTDLRLAAEATGQVEPVRTVEVKSKASGEILRLLVDTGDRVEPGDLLAKVDPRDVRNAFNQATADLEVAEARVEISEAQLNRSQELLASGVITTQEHEGANLEFANAKAALVKAQTNLELARLRLGDVTIRAPLAGTIIEKNVEEGQVIQSASSNVSGGTTLFQMANLDRMRVRTLVDETDVGQLAAGMPASVRVEAFPDRTFEGQVEKIEPQAVVQQNVTMFPVIVDLDNQAGLLKPGMNAEVEVEVAERPGVLTVPNNAVVDPQQYAAAAEVLGLNPDQLDFDLRTAFGGFRGQRAANGARAGSGAGAQPGADGPGGSPVAGGAAARPDGQRFGGQGGFPADSATRTRLAAIRERVQSGEISQDSARVLFRAARGNLARTGGSADAGVEGGVEQGRNDGRPAIAFIVAADGTLEPRAVRLGLSDWDQTEVSSGLEQGDRVALIGAAQLQARQQEFLNRIRNRMGGPLARGNR